MTKKIACLTGLVLAGSWLASCSVDSSGKSTTFEGNSTTGTLPSDVGNETFNTGAGGATAARGTKATLPSLTATGGTSSGLQTTQIHAGGTKGNTVLPVTVAGSNGTGGSTAITTGSGTAPTTVACQRFSFFVTSMAAMIELSENENGFGGDLRYPKGTGDGLSGADAICAKIAAKSLPCAASKTWRAFLSTATVDAIDRIGKGPWYDRKERRVWNDTTEMIDDRPPNAPDSIRDDLPNEDGIPNHDYDLDGSTTDDDNHDILTGSGKDGRKIASDTPAHRCNEWTSTTVTVSSSGGSPGPWGGMGFGSGPMCGHSWPRFGSGTHWASSIREGGCGAGINLKDDGGATSATVGSGGGYGGIYCFALSE